MTAPSRLSLSGVPRRTWLIGAAGLVLALLIGYAAGYLTPRLGAPGDASAEAGFARDMSDHHAQAVEMGMIAFQRSTRPDVRTLGGDIALTQQGQIGQMGAWLNEWGLNRNSSNQPMAWMPGGTQLLRGNLMPGMATATEMTQLRSATGRTLDVMFCQLMLRHHLGGIHMVDGLLAVSHNQSVRALAQTMKDNQLKEIDALRSLLNSLGAQP